jgi:signal transduction histidine kinase
VIVMGLVFHDRKGPPWQMLAALFLLVLLVALGTLQYRWLGEVSEVERARMRDSLRTRASEFALAFDRELTRTYSAFHLTSEQLDAGEAAAVDDAYAKWRSAARTPAMVKAVYVAEGTSVDSAGLRRLDPARHALDAVPWPDDLAASLAQAHQALPSVIGTAQGPAPILIADAIDARIPAFIIPVARISRTTSGDGQITVLADAAVPARVVIVVLDADQLRQHLVEPLVAAHFGDPESSEYLITIARRDSSGSIVYNSGATPVDESAADVTTGIFGLRADELNWIPDRFTPGVAPPGGGRVAVTIVRKSSGHDAGRAVASAADGQGAWEVRARHRAGSLDAIVARSRRRNLAIGLGVLGLLAASFVLVVAAAQRQQKLARQQMEFVAAVSHELRTPLAVICSAGENLADGVVADSAQIKRYGSLIETEGRRLGDMVERVLQFAGIGSGTTVRADAPVDVAAVIADAVNGVGADARDRGVTVTVDATGPLPPIAGDADALRSAVQNVVGNAVKYSHPGGAVDVRVEVLHGSIVRIRVVDRGIGIDAADLPHVFQPFYRGRRAVDAQVRGTGVGLSVVQHVIQTHGGDLHIDSGAGEGTTVTIALPAAPGSEAPEGRGRMVVRLRRGAASAEP